MLPVTDVTSGSPRRPPRGTPAVPHRGNEVVDGVTTGWRCAPGDAEGEMEGCLRSAAQSASLAQEAGPATSR